MSASRLSGGNATILFLCGWPACGSSEYGAWLAENEGFIHLDLTEESTRPDTEVLVQRWKSCVPSAVSSLVDVLLSRHPRWVVTADSPVEYIAQLSALRTAGVSLWFLQPHADNRSRLRWLAIERGRDPAVKPATWDKMATAIRSHARELRPHFRDRCVETLGVSGELIDSALFLARLGLKATRA